MLVGGRCMSWAGLAVDARWPCGHAKTAENTQTWRGQSAHCKECHRQYSRDYWAKKRAEYQPDADEVIEGEVPMNEDDLAQWAREELERLGVTGIVGEEFERARQRYQNGRRR